MTTMQMLLMIAGALHFTLLAAGLAAVRVFDWKRELATLKPMSRQLIWVHAGYVAAMIVAIGAASVLLADDLSTGTPLARAVCGYVALFWLARLAVGFFVFDARPHLTSLPRRVGYVAITLVFAYFAVVYSLAALAPRAL